MSEILDDSIRLLQQLIATPSFSREEADTAMILTDFFAKRHIPIYRKHNNIWAKNLYFDVNKPILLLNSHHDTVKPVEGWSRHPFQAKMENEILYGLGSNDAGGALVSLIATFLNFYEKENLPYNIIIAATAEEEISGANGVESIFPEIGKIWAGIVGEPTQMRMAIAEKGLLVVDAEAKGKAGHAARNEGENAIYKALQDVKWIQNQQFEKVSDLLGPVKMTVTQIHAGTQHNVVPDLCKFVIDIRTNECYHNREIFEILQESLHSDIKARSFRLNSSRIDLEHPLVKAGLAVGLDYFGSPTLSDQALMNFPTLKIGPGDSARSHTADEFIKMEEIEKGIELYISLLEKLAEELKTLL
ncbi:MAG: M20 family metallo-hydrolase [Saprospiraceae bacterium]|nr:M20 family metallo-hydrolase [Saprospiraceae bacterium]